MLKKLFLTAVVTTSLLCSLPTTSAILAVQTQNLMPFEYDFKPNKPIEFENPLPFPAGIRCTATTVDADAPIKIQMLKKSGDVDGRHVSSPNSLTLIIENDQKFKIKADGFAKVRLVNMAEHKIHAKCEV